MMKYRAKASVSIYVVLMLVLIVTLLFSVLEAARVRAVGGATYKKALQETESVYAAYHLELNKQYGLFFLEGDGQKSKSVPVMDSIIYESEENEDYDFLGSRYSSVVLDAYLLATDYEGEVFRTEAANCAKMTLTKDAIEKVTDSLTETQNDTQLEQKKEDALELLEQIEDASQKPVPIDAEKKARMGEEEAAKTEPTKEQKELVKKYGNPLKQLKKWGSDVGYSMIIEDVSKISNQTIENKNLVSHRTLATGKKKSTLKVAKSHKQTNAAKDILYIAYLNHYFQSYMGCEEERPLCYELEYILNGKDSDRKNLNATLTKLFLLREGCNYATILKDRKKCELAYALASAILAPTGLQGMATLLQQGILLAWAYGESILDVRALLAGKKISLMKTVDEWTLNLDDLGKITDVSFQAKENKNGISYQNYLWALLYLQKDKVQTYRTMDLVELNVAKTTGNGSFAMDRMILSSKMTYCYEAKGLFLSLLWTTGKEPGSHLVEQKVEYSY
ncbi:DUF5702 domain-containing protein [Eubacterium oxidoreducens]|uniref:Uncharacterized protein n=1 Tax=Eubacterium oxidoreducens TaxID=1732 RepID=A0A1G5ZZV2_EUBOX|nr:DUF5702 domain-containing protein [Eubacterium oxidoreducens]SDB01734.1 hypothetical protein SAMN02910417_00057 [Eubacterium oxidoreducens]